MLSDTAKALITFVKSAVTKTEYTEKVSFDPKELISLCQKHHISELVYTGADNKDRAELKPLFLTASSNLLKSEIQQKELEAVTELLTDAGADYMLLKGCILKDLYPSPSMRVMGDIDLLIKEKDYPEIERRLLASGHKKVTESTHEYIFKSASGVILELHKMLIPSYNVDFYNYFGDGWQRAHSVGGHAFTLTNEDAFIYLFSHFTKHYRDGGIGIKHLVDLYLFIKKKTPNQSYIQRELEKLSLSEFYGNIREVMDYWFEGAPSTPKSEHISEIIIASGAYGSRRAQLYAQSLRAALTQEKSAGGASLIIRNAFPPLHAMAINYKYLKKAPLLLPFAWCHRLLRIFIHKRKLIKSFTKNAKSVSKQDVKNYYDALRYVGLDYNFKEQNK